MTPRTTVLPAVIDYLVSTFQNASTLGQADPPVAVYDGPTTTGEAAQQVLWVGMLDPDTVGAPIGAESQQEWVGVGARQRNEYVTIHCVAEAWSGSTDVQSVRQAAFDIVAAVEVLLQADPTLGGLVLFTDPTMPQRQLRQNNTQAGQLARIWFSVKAKARIGGS